MGFPGLCMGRIVYFGTALEKPDRIVERAAIVNEVFDLEKGIVGLTVFSPSFTWSANVGGHNRGMFPCDDPSVAQMDRWRFPPRAP
jgi:hypothetical protein